MRSLTITTALLLGAAFNVSPVSADGPSAEELARKAQDPLADTKAIMTDNTIGFGTADDDTAYGFQIQPVYSLPTGDRPYNLILRSVIPIVGAPVGAGLPRLGDEPIRNLGTEWGLSDIFLQAFWSPKTDAGIKWGIGPQVSLRTRTSERVGGPGWGGGISGVIFGGVGDLSYGGLIGQHWGEDNYNVASIQPIVFYNVNAIPGAYVGYSNTITYSWKADSGNRWQVPLGLTVGRTIPMGSRGDALDLNIGAYSLVAKPEGGADWQLKFGISWIFP
jgi:hypothetical protein